MKTIRRERVIVKCNSNSLNELLKEINDPNKIKMILRRLGFFFRDGNSVSNQIEIKIKILIIKNNFSI